MKPETQIKKQMEAFIASNGLKATDVAIGGTRYILMPPNRFGQGYVRVISPTTVWVADLNRNNPTKVSTPKSRVAV